MDTQSASLHFRSSPSIAVRRAQNHSVHPDLLFLPPFHSFSALADPAKAPRSVSPPSHSALFYSLEDLGSFGKDPDSDGFFLQSFDSPPSTSPSSPYTLADTTPGAYFEPSASRAMQESSLPPTPSPHLAPPVPKKRPSLQSIFIPTFLQQPPSIPLVSPVTRPRSRVRSQSASSNVAQQLLAASSSRSSSKTTSPRDSPPPEYLIDEDPFAAISPGPIAGPSTSYFPQDSWYDVGDITSNDSGPYPSFGRQSSRSPRRRSRTNPSSPTGSISRPSRRPSTGSTVPAPNPRRPLPAHARPAFAPRPSLPSLRTLAQADFVYPIKARKGTLGARLPIEPWNMDQGLEVSSPATSIAQQHPSPDPSALTASPNTLHSNREQLISENVNSLSPDTVLDGVSLNVASQPLGETASHVFSEEETDLAYTRSSASLESDGHYDADDSADDMFSSFINALSTLSSPSHSRSSSQSSSSAFSPILSSPESISRSSDGLSRGSSESDHSDFGVIGSAPDEYDSFSLPAPDFDDAVRDDARSPSIPISPRPGRTPHNSISYMPGGFPGLDDFTPGTSLETVRGPIAASTAPTSANRMSVASIEDEKWFSSNEDELDALVPDQGSDGEPVDAGDGHYGGSGHNGQSTSGSGGGGREHSDSRGTGRDYGNGSAGGSGSGQGGRDGRDGDRRNFHHNGAPPSYTTSEDTEFSDDEDLPPKPTATRRQRPSVTSSRGQVASASTAVAGEESSDDDVPLAQRIPTALKAQRTIRRQVRDETDQRRKERAVRRLQDALSADVSVSAGPSQDASRRPSRDISRTPVSPKAVPAPEPTLPTPTGSVGRARTKTLPGNMSRPFPVDALAEKLAKVSANNTPPTSFRRPSHPSDDTHAARHSGSGGDEQSHSLPRERTLKPMRSFHRTHMPDHSMSTPDPAPMPPQSTGRTLDRSSTNTRRPKREESQSRPGTSDGPLRAKSIKRHKSIDDSTPGRSGTLSARTSTDNDVARAHRPPVPAVPPAEVLSALLPAGTATQPVATHATKSQVAWQQRVFVGDMQRFNMVEIGPATTSKEVIEMLDGQAQLTQWVGAGGWMLYEVAQDFGMERPIRNFEVVADIVNSWDKDRTVNMLVARKTALASLLHSSAMPASSPVHQGYVEWESKRGKWNKRWLELREHSLWLSKRDNGKDAAFLCSLSNFDAYQVTRPHKAPKSFVFAVKSTDNLTFFENAADYVHIFSCLDKEGQNWLEKLLLARSYIINQERNIITNAPTGPTAPSSKSLSRAGTRKGARPAQPLVSVPAPQPGLAAATPGDKVFAPGSLLGQR